jgi:hypothetical protein
MRILVKTTWLFPILIVGLAALAVMLPISISHRVLADGPPTTDEVHARVEDAQPLAYPALAEPVAEESDPADATAQFDTSTQGTY